MPEFRATYRLMFSEGFRFADARALVPYLRDLGVSHVYLPPSFQARGPRAPASALRAASPPARRGGGGGGAPPPSRACARGGTPGWGRLAPVHHRRAHAD